MLVVEESMPGEAKENLVSSAGNARRANTAQAERVEHSPEQAQQAKAINIELEQIKNNKIKAKFLRLLERIKEKLAIEKELKKEKEKEKDELTELKESVKELIYDPSDGPLTDYENTAREHGRQAALRKIREKFGEKAELETIEEAAIYESQLRRGEKVYSAEDTLHQEPILEAERIQRFADVIDPDNISAIEDPNLKYIIEWYKDLIDKERQAPGTAGQQLISSADLINAQTLLETRMNQQPPIGDVEAQQVREMLGKLRYLSSSLSKDEHLRGNVERYETEEQYKIIGNVIDDETRDRMKLEKIVWNKRARDKVFNDLYATVDAKPHELWERAFNQLIEGMREAAFMTYIQSAYTRGREAFERKYGTEVIHEYASLRKEELKKKYGAQPQDQDTVFRELQQELQEDYDIYQREKHARETLHNANAILYRTDIQPEQLFNYIKQLSSELGDRAHRFQGVRNMMDIYEEQVRLAMLRHNGYLRAEDILGTTTAETRVERGKKFSVRRQTKKSSVETIAKQIFEDRYNRGMIYVHPEDGPAIDMRSEHNGADIQDWELERIMTIARGMMIASQRMLSLAAESRLTGAARINQLFLQDILYAYSYFIHLDAKYHFPGMKPTGALIFEPGIEKWGPGDLWIQPHRLRPAYKLHEQWKEHPVEFLESHDLADLQRQNPNRAGDLFTWLSDWRVKENVRGNETIIRDFAERGEREMLRIYLDRNPNANLAYTALRSAAFTPNITPEEFFVQHNGVSYENLIDANKPFTEYDVAAVNLYIYLNGGVGVDVANREQIRDLNDRLNEYVKWIGTGLRFELMRSTLTYLDAFKDKKKQGDAKAAVPKAMELLSHIVDFQPDKIFLKSRKIQARVMPELRKRWQDRVYTKLDGTKVNATVDGIFSEDRFEEVLQSTMADLSFMQETIYKNRGKILERGRSFDDMRLLDRNGNILFDLDLIYDTTAGAVQPMLDIARPNPNDEYYEGEGGAQRLKQDTDRYEALRVQREEMRKHIQQQLQTGTVKEFIELMQEDWDTHHGGIEETKRHNGAKKDNNPSYFEEFIKYREYYHGFVLWSGDAPLDEFHMTSIGPTGSFTMRAGNSLDNYKAAQAGNDLLGNLKNIQTPDQAIPFLQKIYSPIFNYDANHAQEVMGEWAERLLKVYGSDWQYVIPLWGGLRGWIGKSAFVQDWYGKRMAIWQAGEKRYLIDLMKEKGYLSDAKYNELKVLARARWWWEIPVDKLDFPLQLLVLAGFIYVLKKGLSDDER